ncbi:MAG: hypothetical protein A2301_00705 [Candidatus Magasanikbacteria bacterium RIFOXYB2_FULL_40_13]|uniref:PPM-type phosphatase domain-containing protein n=2 Tax=Candidatus Magasanikiibacteriota TaxID=1752731 RepID=A0A1F6NUT3_9BACT|nr:MAG: hypothetical protein A2224_01240 [Candidatus Magasanikbacteria bacterium RIFOXYA2_FULL_40_20]OGH86885.1 MAG: hypothetical protein A2301_00705 [Candidatus Magasanikbacteria bacterium RIFOXYB2_FULL_40_13]OGH87685.1 MAG: hypothetical protein A2206_01980 [Candidatus Magasanikbacteria bacterium RIFOXYA1_FULL_40_8]
MSKRMVDLREFFVEGGDNKKSHVLLQITEPANSYEQENKGYFFALAEINGGDDEQVQLLQQMIDDIETGYYETKDTDEKDAFELTLEYINRRGHLFLNKRSGDFNCVIGTINRDKISFSYHGKPLIKVIFAKRDKYELYNVLENEDESSGQLFSAIMQGEIKENDFFQIATPHVSDHISDRQLINTLSARSSRQSSEYIQKILSSLRDGLSYGGIIISIQPKNKRVKPLSKELDEEETKEIIEEKPKPAVHADPPKKAESVETNYRPREEKEYDSVFNMILVNLGRSLVLLLTTLFKLLKNFFVLIGKAILGLFILATNKGGQRAMVIQSFNDFIASKKQYIKNLPIISKILFLLTLLLAVIFAGSIIYLNITKSIRQQQQDYINQTQAIEDKKTAAEASMIYGDDKKAFDLLKEAQSMIDSLPMKNQAQEERKKELMSGITENLKILQKLNTVTTEIIADFSADQASAQTEKLARINDMIIAYGPNDLFVYKYDMNTNVIEKKDHQTIPNLFKSNTPKEQDKVVFLTKENGIAVYSPESGVISSKEIFNAENSVLSDIFVYSQKLYAVDTANNEIYRHNPTQLGYDKGSAWLKTDTDIHDAVSLAIDGDLFLLKSDGQILKFVSGYQQEFTIAGLDPKLENPTEIWTYNNLKYLYILEPTHKRVVVLDKNGQMLQQYTSDSWQNPTGMIVDEENKVIYILDNNKIHRFGTQ